MNNKPMLPFGAVLTALDQIFADRTTLDMGMASFSFVARATDPKVCFEDGQGNTFIYTEKELIEMRNSMIVRMCEHPEIEPQLRELYLEKLLNVVVLFRNLNKAKEALNLA